MTKLVMIDDNPMEHLIMKKILASYAIFPNAVHSLDGLSMINFLEENIEDAQALPDLIFLDLHMPAYSGWNFLDDFRLLHSRLSKPISIYIISSSIDPLDHTRADQFPFVKSFIIKPVSKDTLIAIHSVNQ